MYLKRLHKGLIVTALAAVAIGALAVVAGGGPRNDTDLGGSDRALLSTEAGGAAGDDNVMAQIDRALGRKTASEAAPSVQGKNGGVAQSQTLPNDVRTAPASRDGAAANAGGATASTSTAPVAPPAPGLPGDALSSAADRKIVQTASLRLQVKGVGASFEEVGRIATGAGGFVASSNFSYQGDQQVASATIRVPSARYQEVLSQLRSLGAKVDSESSNASDVTEDYSDLTARLRNLEATETQLLTFLGQARNVGEVLQVQDRLNNVRNEIERTKGRMNLLDKLSDLATITVHLRPVVAGSGADNGGGGLGAEITKAWQDSLDFLGGIATGVITVIVFVWWLPFLLIPAYAAWLRFGRRMSAHAQVVAHD